MELLHIAPYELHLEAPQSSHGSSQVAHSKDPLGTSSKSSLEVPEELLRNSPKELRMSYFWELPIAAH